MGKVNEDDEWTGESDHKNLVANMRKGKLPRYSTRSKDSKGGIKDTKASKNSKLKKATSVDETGEEVDDDDETLGGFIVADEGDDKEEENDDEEEEEFEDDDDDELDD